MYDLIGDIHGYARPLEALLRKLGYRERFGVWSHPERQVIFVGDFVDRGPQQLETVQIARAMVEHNTALAVMGNHEFNAVAYATPHPHRPSEFLRPHTLKNARQHAAFLNAVAAGSALHHEIIEWFKTLPLYLDLPDLRVVHACWHEPSLQVMDNYLSADNCLLPSAWSAASIEGHEAYEATEILLKGLEIPLPNGAFFLDKDANRRDHVRSRWWQTDAASYQDAAIVPPAALPAIPAAPVPPGVLPGYDERKPLFLGHYWMVADKPEPLTDHIACLDYSIASPPTEQGAVRGKLVAYRWQGERTLTTDHFVWVS